MSITLAMIVRNEERNLPTALESVRGLFDETVIVDTGSTDRTVKIARSSGARVFRFAWCDDFSAARNFGLDRVQTDYFLRLDADDCLFAGHRKRLAALLARLSADRPEAYTFDVHSILATGSEMVCQEFRLFPAYCRYRGRIHERVRIEDYAPRLAIGPAHVRIDHSGYSDAETYRAKLRRNYAILLEDSQRPAVDRLTWLDLGRTEEGLGYDDDALQSLERFLELAGDDEGLLAARRAAERIVAEIHDKRSDLPLE